MKRLALGSFVFLAYAPLALAQDPSLPDSPWSLGLVASMVALALGGMAAVLGLWIGRDKERPISFALAMTVLIGATIGVGITQSFLDAEDGVQKRADLARMMSMVREIAVKTGDLELAALIEAEGGAPVDMPEPEPEPEVVEEPEEGADGAGDDAAEGEEQADAEDIDGADAPAGEE